jgi:selenocysteine-specific translation elongation factor
MMEPPADPGSGDLPVRARELTTQNVPAALAKAGRRDALALEGLTSRPEPDWLQR